MENQITSTDSFNEVNFANQKKCDSKIYFKLFIALLFFLSSVFTKQVYGFTPTLSFGYTNIFLHVGDTIHFVNASIGFPTNQTYLWNFGLPCDTDANGNPVVDKCNDTITGLQSVDFIFPLPGTYPVKLKGNYNGTNYEIEKIITVYETQVYGCQAPGCNLITNGDFEDIQSCPLNREYLGNGTFFPISGPGSTPSCWWWYPTYGSPDLYINATTPAYLPCNINTGQPIVPFHGVGMAGFTIYFAGASGQSAFREYIEEPLVHALVPGKSYRIRMHVNLYNISNSDCNKSSFQISFVKGPVSNFNTPGPLITLPTPNIMLTGIATMGTWTAVDIIFTAPAGCVGVDHIIIGNIGDDTSVITGNDSIPCDQAAYLLVDSMALYATNELDAIINSSCKSSPGSIDLNDPCTPFGTSAYSGPFSYQWSNGAMTQDLTGVPGGIYIVTVTSSSGPSLTETFTIGTGQEPPAPIIIGPTTHGDCDPIKTFTIQNYNGTFTYVWTTSTGITSNGPTFTYDFQPFGGGWLTCTVANPTSCCTNSSTFIVVACCQPNSISTGGLIDLDLSGLSVNDIINNSGDYGLYYYFTGVGFPSLSTFYNSNSATNDQIAINGTFTVDHDFEFDKAEILLGPDAKIIVLPGFNLRFDETYLHTCNHEYMVNPRPSHTQI